MNNPPPNEFVYYDDPNQFIPKTKDEMGIAINKSHPYQWDCDECEADKEHIQEYKIKKVQARYMGFPVTQYRKYYRCNKCDKVQRVYFHLNWAD